MRDSGYEINSENAYYNINNNKANRQYPKEVSGKCQKEDLNKMFNKFGSTGFNNQL